MHERAIFLPRDWGHYSPMALLRMRGPVLFNNKPFAERKAVEHVVLALEALPDDAARVRVLLSACSHFRIDLPAAPEATAHAAARASGQGGTAAPAPVHGACAAAADVEAPETLESFRRG